MKKLLLVLLLLPTLIANGSAGIVTVRTESRMLFPNQPVVIITQFQADKNNERLVVMLGEESYGELTAHESVLTPTSVIDTGTITDLPSGDYYVRVFLFRKGDKKVYTAICYFKILGADYEAQNGRDTNHLS